MSFISFFCLIDLSTISSALLTRSDENGHPCLDPDLRGKAFSLTTEMTFADVFLSGFYQDEEVSSHS